MTILENISLAQYTTFKIGGNARFFCLIKSVDDLKEAVKFAKEKSVPFFVLGGGSNVLISDEGFHGLVMKMEIEGISKHEMRNTKYEEKSEIVSAGAGEMWDSFVEWTLEHGFNGLENLSAIPGTVGATPVQNIGAYGVEVGQLIYKVHAFDTQTMKEVELSGRDCHFGYRNSLFKHEKGRYIVTQVDFVLKKDGKVNISYKELQERFGDQVVPPTPVEIRKAVIDIRWHKLPDWNMWGTAGSYFKNPVVTKEKFDELKNLYPEIPGFPETDERGQVSYTHVKIPLGWILDNVCHAKGMMHGRVGTYEKQALVIVTKPGSTARDVVDFTHDLMKQVKDKTGITIEAEVEWVN
jgi:UDP-N-acetylmuramate dehydrogenase